MSEKTSSDPYQALRIRDFLLYIISRFILTFGLQFQFVIVGWQIYELTRDPLSLGLIGLAEAIPALSISLYAGHLADKSDRRKIALFCHVMFLLCALLLLILSIEREALPLKLTVNMFYSVIFLGGIARGLSAPSMAALRAQLIPRELYANSSAWASASWQTGAVLGPALGGLIFAATGASLSYALISLCILVSTVCIFMIAPRPIPQYSSGESIRERLSEGIRFVFGNQVMVGALALDLFAVLFGGAVALLPVFAKDILHVGAQGFGFLRAAPSVGSVIMMLYLAHRPPVHNAGRNLLVAVAGFGVCMIVFALSRNFLLSLGVLALSGAFDSVSVVIRSTIVQTMTPNELMGRVSSVNTMFIGSSNEIGAFESGLVARLMGTVPSVVFGGSMTLLVVGITSLVAPKLRKLHLNQENPS